MNTISKLVTFFPMFNSYLKGANKFNRGDFKGAISYLEKCLIHPKFNNELVFSLYGQALCALGQYDDSYLFLLKACDLYEACGWKFDNDYAFKLAQDTLSALQYISKNTEIELRPGLLEKILVGGQP